MAAAAREREEEGGQVCTLLSLSCHCTIFHWSNATIYLRWLISTGIVQELLWFEDNYYWVHMCILSWHNRFFCLCWWPVQAVNRPPWKMAVLWWIPFSVVLILMYWLIHTECKSDWCKGGTCRTAVFDQWSMVIEVVYGQMCSYLVEYRPITTRWTNGHTLRFWCEATSTVTV